MGMTMTQKIISNHCGKTSVEVGEFVEMNLDIVLGNDITTPVAINEFNKMGAEEVYDKEKIVIVLDHFTPNKDIKSAQQCKISREFAKEKEIVNFFDVGQMGIEHALLPEKGLVVAGDTVIGADSHTCTYGALGAFSTGVGSTDMAGGMALGTTWIKVPPAIKVNIRGKKKPYVSGKDLILDLIGKIGVDGALYKSIEFTGEGIKELSMDDRFAISNMAVEAGGKNGIFPVDDKTINYMEERKIKEWKIFQADEDAVYDQVIDINLNELEPTVACPNSPENTKPVDEIKDIYINQVVIGSCTNGRIEDMRAAGEIFKNRKVNPEVRTIIIPATQEIYKQCIKEGLLEIFIDAGAVVSTPTCGPCLGGHMGILAAGEKAVTTTNRNFVGRMGHKESEVYLASPAVAAASAVTGKIENPNNLK
jgi:3-isopropylmalate/(R)-2-methylmalate dehydratase large subunit